MAKLRSGFQGERAIVLPMSVIEEFKNDTLGSLLHITDIGFYPNAVYHSRSRLKEDANQYILIYCVEGTGWFEIEGLKYKVMPDHFFILPKHKAHRYGSTLSKSWTIYWIHFDGEKAGYFAEEFDRPTRVFPEKNSRIEDRLHLFEEIYSTLKNGYSKNNLDYSISIFFHFLGSLKFLGAYRESIFSNQQTRDVVGDAIHFMRENTHKRLSLKEIADYIGYSSSHFTALFQKKTGHSPLAYYSQLKIQQACHYLDFSGMKITQVSAMVGFQDALYFSRIFSKIMGMSPSEYRNNKKG